MRRSRPHPRRAVSGGAAPQLPLDLGPAAAAVAPPPQITARSPRQRQRPTQRRLLGPAQLLLPFDGHGQRLVAIGRCGSQPSRPAEGGNLGTHNQHESATTTPSQGWRERRSQRRVSLSCARHR